MLTLFFDIFDEGGGDRGQESLLLAHLAEYIMMTNAQCS
jgi:hypothetical protein